MLVLGEFLRINWFIFSVNIVFVILLFNIYKKYYTKVDRTLLIFLLLLIYTYSGFGASFETVPYIYSIMFIIYVITFIHFFTLQLRFNKFNFSDYKVNFILRHSNIFIISYIFFVFINAGYPNFELIKIIKPSAPSLQFDLADSIQESNSPFRKVLSYFILILQPFYLVSLFKFKTKPFKLFIFLFFPLYLYFSIGGYIARSYLLPYVAIYVFMLYFSNPHLRNRLKILIFSLLPIGIVFSVVYSEIRIGNDSELTISLSKALEILIGQETSYPLLFDKVYNFNIPFQGYNFFMWILTLPIPSFIKGNAFSLEVNYLFTELITGKSKNSKDLYILLPGLVTESYIVFGRYLFFLMPLIGATITGFLYRIIKSPIEFLPLRVYFIFMFIPLIARAGLNSAIPVAINGFIFFICFLFIKR